MEDELVNRVGRLQLQLERQSTAPLARSAGVASEEAAVCLLLALPDPLLLEVLRCLTAGEGDQRSLFSAARAHSRLHKAAVAALSSIKVQDIKVQQQRLESVLLYLNKHGQQVGSIDLRGWGPAAPVNSWQRPKPTASLRELPPQLQLHSLELHLFQLQLQPGLLGAAAGVSTLKKLRLDHCVLLDSREGLAAALEQLAPGLEHLSLTEVQCGREWMYCSVPASVLQQMQRLTHLTLAAVDLGRPDGDSDQSSSGLYFLQSLTRLVDLRLAGISPDEGGITASMMSGMRHLTRFDVYGHYVEPGALAGKHQMQHLNLNRCCSWQVQEGVDPGAMLAQLQPLTQLTHLQLYEVTGNHSEGRGPGAAAYSALTASSKLRHLGLNKCSVPAGVWQHVFPAGRQLPHLTSLDISELSYYKPNNVVTVSEYSRLPRRNAAAPPEGSRLISCCPGLRRLNVQYLACTAELLAPLTGLIPGLQALLIDADGSDAAREALGIVWQLTGLQELDLDVRMVGSEGLLMQAAQLRQLTKLCYAGQHKGDLAVLELRAQDPGDKPVWRQVLTRHLRHRSPAIVQQAIRALAE